MTTISPRSPYCSVITGLPWGQFRALTVSFTAKAHNATMPSSSFQSRIVSSPALINRRLTIEPSQHRSPHQTTPYRPDRLGIVPPRPCLPMPSRPPPRFPIDPFPSGPHQDSCSGPYLSESSAGKVRPTSPPLPSQARTPFQTVHTLPPTAGSLFRHGKRTSLQPHRRRLSRSDSNPRRIRRQMSATGRNSRFGDGRPGKA